MGEIQPPREVVQRALKKGPLYEVTKKGVTTKVEVKRGENKGAYEVSGAVARAALKEQILQELIIKDSKSQAEAVVPSRANPEADPAATDTEALRINAETILVDIDSKKSAYDRLAQRIMTTEGLQALSDLRAGYEAKAEKTLIEKEAASRRSVLSREIMLGYQKVVEDPEFAEALAAIAKIPRLDEKGNVIQKERTPKEKLQALLASDLLKDGQKDALRYTLIHSLDTFSRKFIGNRVVEKFKKGLAQQWESPAIAALQKSIRRTGSLESLSQDPSTIEAINEQMYRKSIQETGSLESLAKNQDAVAAIDAQLVRKSIQETGSLESLAKNQEAVAVIDLNTKQRPSKPMVRKGA